MAFSSSILAWTLLIIIPVLLGAGVFLMRSRLRTPSRQYEGPGSVSEIYDEWTQDQIIEYYWGDHLHVGFYGDPPTKKDFITAKVDLIAEIIKWGIAGPFPGVYERLEEVGFQSEAEKIKILDVGCEIGGTVRHFAKRWPSTAQVSGITISRGQVDRARKLTREQGIENASYFQNDACHLAFPDASFDIVWALESEPHIADKKRFVLEMTRVLKPGGALIIGAWNVRDFSSGSPYK